MKDFASTPKLLAIAPAVLLGGCALVHAPVLDPHGNIALTERNLLFATAGVMQIVLIPVFILTFWFAWWYRASNRRAVYMPEYSQSVALEAVFWLVPALIVGFIGYLVWDYTHRLDPYKPIVAAASPLEVDVIAEDWKWLFIYPEQNMATVNELAFPSDRPLRLMLTSDTVMNSFYVAGLGGQIFAMAGMRTELNLVAEAPADFVGRNLQFTGDGFPTQNFDVRAVTLPDFNAWVSKVKQSPDTLDTTVLATIEKPSSNDPPHYYSSVEPDLFDRVIAKYAGIPEHYADDSAARLTASPGGR